MALNSGDFTIKQPCIISPKVVDEQGERYYCDSGKLTNIAKIFIGRI